jgi:hypothetical protein
VTDDERAERMAICFFWWLLLVAGFGGLMAWLSIEGPW